MANVRASHILLMYKGSARSSATVTRAKAPGASRRSAFSTRSSTRAWRDRSLKAGATRATVAGKLRPGAADPGVEANLDRAFSRWLLPLVQDSDVIALSAELADARGDADERRAAWRAFADAVNGPAVVTALRRLALNCFNYQLLGGDAFRALCDLVDQAGCYEFVFSDLNQAVACLHGLAQGEGSHEPAE